MKPGNRLLSVEDNVQQGAWKGANSCRTGVLRDKRSESCVSESSSNSESEEDFCFTLAVSDCSFSWEGERNVVGPQGNHPGDRVVKVGMYQGGYVIDEIGREMNKGVE